MENIQKHVCCVCGAEAHYQMKNGKWYCTQNYRSCPGLKAIKSQKNYQYWKQLKQRGINKREDIPLEERKRDFSKGQQGICFYCGEKAQYQLKSGRWCCHQYCSQCPANKKKNSKGQEKLNKLGRGTWNKGKPSPRKGQTKQTDQRIKKQAQKAHQDYLSGKRIPYWKGKHLSQEAKRKKSQAMKKYIAENKIYWNKNKNRFKNGWYKGYQCDSSWELAFVIYNLEHNIKFERNKEGFEYQYKGQKHTYFPDFIMEDGTYVQIKGRMTQSVKIKINTFNYPLIVIDQESIKLYLNYAIQKYGKNFISLYQNVNYEDKEYITCPQCGKKMLKQSKLCKYCAPKLKRKVQRPTKEVLEEQLKTNTYTSLGKKYGVTDNAIRRWCKDYNILISKEQMKIRQRKNLLNNIEKKK